MENTLEIWHVEANGNVFETNFDEMTLWIAEGSLLRIDRVRKGNLRWIEAGKVPSLLVFFNAKDNGEPIMPVITTTDPDPAAFPQPVSTGNFEPAQAPGISPQDNVCAMHSDRPAAFLCGTCSNQFCKACPSSYGTNVRICPFCGAMCSNLAKAEEEQKKEYTRRASIDKGFGFGDFANALAYPFKFKTSLILGGAMFMFFSIGQGATSFGGIFMLGASITCFMLTNMLTFGVLANTVENFTQGKLDENFMPSFDDFSMWDDVIHPFFLSIGAYIPSFGPFVVVVLVAVFMVMGSMKSQTNGLQSDAARLTNPELPYASNAAKQSEAVRQLLNKQQNIQKQRVAELEEGAVSPDPAFESNTAAVDHEEINLEEMNQKIQESRKAQLESVVGKTPETVAKERADFARSILAYGWLFLIFGGISMLWGLFYFPAACTVAAYTRSFGATLNPFVGLDTIRRLGLDYVKILLMGLVIVLVSGFIAGVLNMVFAPFDLPGVGNVPARAIGSIFGFYFSVVFSCVIGYALYKASDRLKLPT